jgi:hypothetical protein
MGIVATILAPGSEYVDLIKANRAPDGYQVMLRGTIDPNLLVNSKQDPSLRKVSGRVTGIVGLLPFDAVRVELVDGIRAGGTILTGEVAADGAFEVRNVSPRTYQAIVLKTCKGCNSSKIVSTPVNVVVADKDLTDVRLTFTAQ